MEDVAQEYVAKLLQEEREGKEIPIWPGYFPDDRLKDVERIARCLYDVVLEPLEDCIQQPLPNLDTTRMRKTALQKYEKIKARFTKIQLGQMIGHCAAYAVTQKSLAAAAEIPYRTFKYTIRSLRSSV
jgi:hypothetical protein